MGTLLKASLMALAAGAVLLVAGGFPLLGAPAVYRGGAMLILGLLLAFLSLGGALRLAKGNYFRLGCGLFSCFMAGAGLVVVLEYGGKAIEYAGQGGGMWFGAIAMACTATVGLIFLGLFGFFANRLMTPQLWLAGLHAAVVFVLAGAYIDFVAEVSAPVRLAADGKSELASLALPTGETRELPFRLRVDGFAIDYYEGAPAYSLMAYDSAGQRWVKEASLTVEGDRLTAGSGEAWPLAQLQTAPGMPQPFLVAGQGRVVLQDAATVRDYRARCHVTTWHRGRQEERDELLRVNEPLDLKGWQVSLMSHDAQADGTPVLVLQLRRAPGRFWALTGMAGIILCSAMWCWGLGRKETAVKLEPRQEVAA